MLRQDWIQEHAKDEELQKEFEERRNANLAVAESKTAKKRAKRYACTPMSVFNSVHPHVCIQQCDI